MSKLDDILENAHKEGRRRPEGYGKPLNDGKEEIKKLILDLLKESDYDQFEFVEKVSKL